MRRTIITATAALLAVSACTTGDDGAPERYAHVAEASEECDAPGVRVHPLRAGAAAVTTSCSNFEDSDNRAWLGDRELEPLERIFDEETMRQVFEELEYVVGEGTVLDALARAQVQAGEGVEFTQAAIGHIDRDPSGEPVLLASNPVTLDMAEVPLHP